jgi:hypothetical protein
MHVFAAFHWFNQKKLVKQLLGSHLCKFSGVPNTSSLSPNPSSISRRRRPSVVCICPGCKTQSWRVAGRGGLLRTLYLCRDRSIEANGTETAAAFTGRWFNSALYAWRDEQRGSVSSLLLTADWNNKKFKHQIMMTDIAEGQVRRNL